MLIYMSTTRSRRRRPAPADELDHVFAVVARYFAVLSEPMRLKILHTICQDERSVSAVEVVEAEADQDDGCGGQHHAHR